MLLVLLCSSADGGRKAGRVKGLDVSSGVFSVGTLRVLLKSALAVGEHRRFCAVGSRTDLFVEKSGEFWAVPRIVVVP